MAKQMVTKLATQAGHVVRVGIQGLAKLFIARPL